MAEILKLTGPAEIKLLNSNQKEVIGASELPKVILGGMGVGISDRKLCKAAALAGEKLGEKVLPFVSGTGLPFVMVDRLQSGDQDTVRALRIFDLKFNLKIGEKIIAKYPQRPVGEKHLLAPRGEVLVTNRDGKKAEMEELAIASAFVEVYLAKEDHNNPIGINLLEKVQPMLLPTILGAIMAGVDHMEIGAGVPYEIPKVSDNFVNGKEASYKLDVTGLKDGYMMTLDPKRFIGERKLKKPKFYPIISLHVLAKVLSRIDGVDGFIVAGNTAGHRVNPRDKENGVIDGISHYADKDFPKLDVIKGLRDKSGNPFPFWLAGGYAGKLKEAIGLGATGVQVGTLFALCNESGMREDLKRQIREIIVNTPSEDLGKLVVISRWTSPTDFSFCVAQVKNTLSDEEIYEGRTRSCKYACLPEYYVGSDGKIDSRCPAEPVEIYKRKGGKEEDTVGRRCLCEGLISTAGHTEGYSIVTLGTVLGPVKELMEGKENGEYSIEDALRDIFSQQ